MKENICSHTAVILQAQYGHWTFLFLFYLMWLINYDSYVFTCIEDEEYYFSFIPEFIQEIMSWIGVFCYAQRTTNNALAFIWLKWTERHYYYFYDIYYIKYILSQ